MASRLQEAPAGAAAPSPARPRQNFETWSWFFMRISGLILVFLALIHFAVMHITNDVVHTDSGFVSNRWSNPLWRIYDWSLLALGLMHGVNGLRMITDDYVRRPATRAFTKALLYSVTFAMFAYGTLTIITFTSYHKPL
ncbi:MAG TPA: succinate dehydrogenase hydrophobic membrane anchor subunit [Acidimicrobiales bacterium]